MKFKQAIGFSALGLTVALLSSACTEEVENTLSCRDVCERYEDCVEDDFDVSDCTDQCEDMADASEDQEARLEECDNCLEDKSCAEGAFNCSDECFGVLP